MRPQCLHAASLLLVLLLQTLTVSTALPLDDTHRNGLWEDEESHLTSAVYTALSSSKSSSGSGGGQTSIRAAALYLGIDQHIQAPELTNPPRMPQCLGSSKVSKALTAAINGKYAGQLQQNASVDTTYIQDRLRCDYSSFITYSGPEQIRTELVDAANANKLCDLLPKYCQALNLIPAPAPTATAGSSSSSSGHSAATPAPSESTPPPPAAAAAGVQPIDSRPRRGIQRRSSISISISSTDPYLLTSSSGTASPELPPVLDFKCVKHNFTQVRDHFADQRQYTQYDHSGTTQHGVQWGPAARRLQESSSTDSSDSSTDSSDSSSVSSSSSSRHEDDDEFDVEHLLDRLQRSKQEKDRRGTFEQVYWVCDAAWPEDADVQEVSGNVIVFLGNESPLGIPKQPIVFENARRLNALVVLVEHRYYGESLPYPEPENQPVPTDKYRWLTIEQVIEDTATVVQHVRKQRGVPKMVPNIVIGGSYGGMIASYHRVVRPDVFDAAIAASAPIYYIVDTKMWRHTSNRYHQFIEDSANTMSGSRHCSDTVRAGLEELLQLGQTSAGREEVVSTMRLCGTASKVLQNQDYVLGLQEHIIGTFQGLAQVNNQPPVLGEMAIACEVINNATAAGQKPLAAVSALYSYFSNNGSSNWCYNFTFNPKAALMGEGGNGFQSYPYQCCTQGTVFSSLLPARGSDSTTLNPEDIPVPLKQIEGNCRVIFGRHVPELQGPGFARHIMPLLKKYGNVVFTNGDLDGWAGGSLGLLPQVPDSSSSSAADDSEGAADAKVYEFGDLDSKYGGFKKHSAHVAFVVYRNASHCTDTHTNTWRTPGEPPKWQRQRALAMNYAAEFARKSKGQYSV